MQCPICRIINPDSAEICDCGFNFGKGIMGISILPESAIGLSPLCRAGCFLVGFLSSWHLLTMLVVAIVAGILFNIYQRQFPAKASDGIRFFGLGLLVPFLIGLMLAVMGIFPTLTNLVNGHL